MKILVLLFGIWLACGNVLARPLVLESPNILPIAPTAVAHAGDELIATEWLDADPNDPDAVVTVANLYRRTASGQWVFERTLLSETAPASASNATVAMSATVAGIVMPSGLHVFERNVSGWVESPLDVTPRPRGRVIDVEGSTILATDSEECSFEAPMLERGANGHWAESARLAVDDESCITGLDLDSAAAIVHSTFSIGNIQTWAQIFERAASGWALRATFESPESERGYFGPAVAIHGALAIVSGADLGAHVYRRSEAGWTETGLLRIPGAYDYAGHYSAALQITDDYVLQVGANGDRHSGGAYVYRQLADQTFEHLANLVTDGPNGISTARLSGHRVIGIQRAAGPLEFELPANYEVPPLVQDDFEAGPAQWSRLPGSRFAIAKDGVTHVFRQSSLAGDAAAFHSADRTNQSVSADVRPLAFNGADRWVGLMTRYTGEANYYYVTLRSSGHVVLKRKLQGVYTELASVPFDVMAGRHYRVTLESSGSRHAVFVDDRFLMEAYDAELTHGHAGLRTYKASADFDNVVVSPGPRSNFTDIDLNYEGAWYGDPFPFRLYQESPVGLARLLVGPSREDAVVQAMVTVETFGSGSPWVGLIARYVDEGNYYYVTARKSNQLSLRKLTNGAITVLGTVSLSVAPGQPFELRLEAIGDRLRAYINNELRLERRGVEVVAGQAGAVTYNSAAHFQVYRAHEP